MKEVREGFLFLWKEELNEEIWGTFAADFF